MAKEKYTHRLPQPRVSEKLFNLVHKVAAAQELGLADITRLALEDYCSPMQEVDLPIAGEIVADEVLGNKIVFYPYIKIEGVPVKTLLDNVIKERSRYLEVEPVG
jgi:hypothetical protein